MPKTGPSPCSERPSRIAKLIGTILPPASRIEISANQILSIALGKPLQREQLPWVRGSHSLRRHASTRTPFLMEKLSKTCRRTTSRRGSNSSPRRRLFSHAIHGPKRRPKNLLSTPSARAIAVKRSERASGPSFGYSPTIHPVGLAVSCPRGVRTL